MSQLLVLDLSTTCTGFGVFDRASRRLVEYGTVKPDAKGLAALTYPKGQLRKLQNLAEKLRALIEARPELSVIVVEEINRGVSRLSQKTLDGAHYVFLDRLDQVGTNKLDLVRYVDSDGATGWRTGLGIRLTDQDKLYNHEVRKYNRKRTKGDRKKPEVDRKKLACKFANEVLGLQLDSWERTSDADIADALCLGLYYLGLERQKAAA